MSFYFSIFLPTEPVVKLLDVCQMRNDISMHFFLFFFVIPFFKIIYLFVLLKIFFLIWTFFFFFPLTSLLEYNCFKTNVVFKFIFPYYE